MSTHPWLHTSLSFAVRATTGLTLILGLAANTVTAEDKDLTGNIRASESRLVKPGEVPQGMDAESWSSIQAQIEQSRYELQPSSQGVGGANPEQGWTLEFDSSGLSLNRAALTAPVNESRSVRTAHENQSQLAATLLPLPSLSADQNVRAARAAGFSLNLRTTGIGRADALNPVTGATPVVRGNRVELHHPQATEWYINTAAGLEHGYTFEQAPRGARGEVRIAIALDGGLSAQASDGGVLLADADGAHKLRYHKLLVQDADGRSLGSRLEVTDPTHLQVAFDDRAARYPVTVDPLLINLERKLKASDPGFAPPSVAENDDFGASVAMSGDTLLVGAYRDDVDFFQSEEGSAYVFVRSGTTWTEQQKLSAPDGERFDRFGFSVALSGDTALIGAPDDNHSNGGDFTAGSAYVFVRSAGTWTFQQQLFAADGGSDGGQGDRFGTSVALSGNTALIGAPRWDFNPAPGTNPDQGAVYVFGRSGTAWTQRQQLVVAGSSGLGRAVAMSPDTALMGAGAATHVFGLVNGLWLPQATLTVADSVPGDRFGAAVAVSGDTAVVGSPNSGQVPDDRRDAAYVFVRAGNGTWTLQEKLMNSNGELSDFFGTSVAVEGDLVLVGASLGNSVRGAATLFRREDGAWIEEDVLAAPDGESFASFGGSVALSGSTAVIGAFDDDLIGSTYVFRFVAPGVALDWGDAPDPSYPTLLANDGARHVIAGPRLGALIDLELNGQPNSSAIGDDIVNRDDEDGVAFGSLTIGRSATVDVEVTGGPALLDAWIDFNRDGDWADPGEQIFDDFIVMNGANPGLVFQVPGTAVLGSTYARVRVSSNGVAVPTGQAPDGEVEDYRLSLISAQAGTVQFSTETYSVNESERTATITLTRTGGSVGSVSALVVTSPGTASAGSDYTPTGGDFALWANGDSANKTVTISLVDDFTVESDETVNLRISSVSGAALGTPSSARLTIIDDDGASAGTVQLSSMTYSVNEAGPTATIALTRSGGRLGAASVMIATSDGSATAGSDYTAINQTVNWTDGDSANKTVSVPISNDATDEPNETVNLSLSNATGSALGAPASAVLTITDNDDPPTPDTTPDAFSFTGVSNVALGSTQTSNAITVSGINAAAAISVANGSYSIGCTATFVTAASTITNGQTVCVRHTASALNATTVTTTLNIGGVTGSFSSTTVAAAPPPSDTTPDAFSFTSVSNVALNSTQTSNAITVSGINAAAPISVSGGAYSIGCTATFVTAAGTITNGQTVCVQHTASALNATSVTTTLTIGGVPGSFTSTTLAAGPPPPPPSDAPFQVQNVRTPSKCLQPEDGSPSIGDPMSAKTCNAGSSAQALTFPVNGNGTFRMMIGSLCIGTPTGSFSDGTRLQLQMCNGSTNQNFLISAGRFAAANAPNQVMDLHGQNNNDVIFWQDYGSTNQRWNQLPLGVPPPPPPSDTPPDPFSFTNLTNVALGSTQTSNAITVSGINAAAAISVADGSYSIGCSATFVSAASTISNGQTVCVRHTASALNATTVTTTLNIGGVMGSFSSTTVAAGPPPFDLAFQVQNVRTPAKCLQPEDGLPSIGDPMSAKTCNAGSAAQAVSFPASTGGSFRMMIGSLCIGTPTGSFSNGTRLQLQMCNGSTNQNFLINAGRFAAVNAPTQVMDLHAGNLNDVIFWQDFGATNQRWNQLAIGVPPPPPPPPPADPAFQVQNVLESGKCLQPDDGSPSVGDLMSAKTCSASTAQNLTFPVNGNGSVRMMIGSLCIGLQGGSFVNGTRLQLQTCTGNANQNFVITGQRFASFNQPNQVMDLHGGNLNDVILWENYGKSNQSWNRVPR